VGLRSLGARSTRARRRCVAVVSESKHCNVRAYMLRLGKKSENGGRVAVLLSFEGDAHRAARHDLWKLVMAKLFRCGMRAIGRVPACCTATDCFKGLKRHQRSKSQSRPILSHSDNTRRGFSTCTQKPRPLLVCGVCGSGMALVRNKSPSLSSAGQTSIGVKFFEKN
jgi:hypothetical protein